VFLQKKSFGRTDVKNDEVSVGDFVTEYSALLSQAHGNVEEEEEEEEENKDVGEIDDEISDNESAKEETPLHFKIVIKVHSYKCFLLPQFFVNGTNLRNFYPSIFSVLMHVG